MIKKSKSVLDGVPVNDDKFKEAFAPKPPLMGIVGTCPKCGAPVYGHSLTADDKPPVRYSCDCRVSVSQHTTTASIPAA